MTDNLLEAIPEKFKDPETGEVRTQALLQSYKELEKKLSQTPGVPKSPDEYCVNCDHGLFEPDRDVNSRLHAKGFTQDQAQEVYDLAAEKLVPMIAELSADFQADREVERLVAHFGGPEKWREISRQLLAYGQKNLPADVLNGLSSSYEGVLALHRMMKGQTPAITRRSAEGQGTGELDLQSMMRDPRYWREKDPAFVAKVTEGFQKLFGN